MNSNEPIKLRRGDTDIVLRKSPDRFAVRLKKGVGKDSSVMKHSIGNLEEGAIHIESAVSERMEIFSIEASKMEGALDRLRADPENEIVTHMYTADSTPEGVFIPTGRMTLQFSPDLNQSARETILRKHGLEIERELDYLPHGYVVMLTSASTQNPIKIAQILQKKSGILVAEPDLSFKVSFKFKPGDTLYKKQWHLNNTGDSTGLLAGADVKAEDAWDHTLGSRTISICVMDDGFDLSHPDFNAPGKIVAPKDFGEDDTDPSPGFPDDNHGTACAGVALAEQNGTGVVGLAPGCALMPVRTSGWLSDDSIENLFQYAMDHHADVISCSWAASAAYFPLSTRMNGIIHKVATQGRSNRKGCVIFFAAGNESAPLKGSKEGVEYHQGFALHPDVVAVAASNSLDEQSYYSNYGEEISVCAPSSGSPGRGIVTTDRRGKLGYEGGDYTYSFGGTSSSTPLCAGLAGLILSVDPDLTSFNVRRILRQSADKIDKANGAYNAKGHSVKYGYGRINARAALDMAIGAHKKSLSSKTLSMEHVVKIPIPDLGEVTDSMFLSIEESILEIEISVDIRHTWRGDLSVILQPPGLNEITLQDRTGGGADNLLKTYRSSDHPVLFQPLVNKEARGEWKLKIADHAKNDHGILHKWGITVTY